VPHLAKHHPVLLALGVTLGVAIGLGFYTFIYAKGSSYLTNNPQACANCHVMQEYYDAWVKSTHRSVAVCNDCHTPPGAVGKYTTKAINGFWHSFAFTSGRFPEALHITGRNQRVSEEACQKCHLALIQAMVGPHDDSGRTHCARCHNSVGHLR
jgi:cytochrome c nitrite reductase small subunit